MEQITDQNAVALTTRNADLSSMVELLRTQQAAKTDHVVAASALAAQGGQMLVHGAGRSELSMDGVTTGDLTLAPTRTADNGIADKLTPREQEILEHVLGGETSKQIADKLGISPRTVEEHRARILQKSGAANTAELVKLAMSAAPAPETRPRA